MPAGRSLSARYEPLHGQECLVVTESEEPVTFLAVLPPSMAISMLAIDSDHQAGNLRSPSRQTLVYPSAGDGPMIVGGTMH
jgi:hypothetical protein